MNEKVFEDIICKYPDLIEENLTFKGRQVIIKGKRVDVLFEDRYGQKLIIELKKGTILREHIAQLLDYEGEYVTPDDPNVRVMLIGNRVPENLRRSLNHHGFEWKEISIALLIKYINNKSDVEMLNAIKPEDILIPDKNISKSFSGPLAKVDTSQALEISATSINKAGLSAKEINRYNFLSQLIELCRTKTNLFSGVSVPTYQNWIATGAGKSGLLWQFVALEKSARVEFWLCTSSAEINLKRYEFIKNYRDEIEKKFGEPLVWDHKENNKLKCIRYICTLGGFEKESEWKIIHSDLLDHLLKMEFAFRDIIYRIE